jgi:phosphoribosylanthranilate isomerase
MSDVKVKICGLGTEATLDAAIEAGADYVGLVFCARSPRNVDLATAGSLARRAHERSRAKVVALVVDADDALLDAILRDVAPDVLQLHGHESAERVAAIRARFGLPLWKAVPVATAADVGAGLAFMDEGRLADLVLFDARPPPCPAALPGGNGLAFDWRILTGIAARHPFVLAGGLTPDNVAAAVELVRPAVVDVSSGVESAPGVKDPALIRRFIRAAKAAKEAS